MSPRQKRFLGWSALAVGIGLAAVLAFAQGGSKPPSRATDALLVVLIAISQGGSAWAFGSIGKADPSHVRQSAAKLVATARMAQESEKKVQAAFESGGTQHVLRTELGIASRDLSWIVELLAISADDWRVAFPEAFPKIEES